MTGSPTEQANAEDAYETEAGNPDRRSSRARAWTRRLHNYLGLFLLLFLWMFSVSGLVLNHSTWPAGNFWEAREESTAERTIRAPAATGDVAIAADLTGQLGIVGEVGDIRRHADGAQLAFQVVKPGQVFRVDAHLDSAVARVTEIRVNAWGVMDALHKFTGVKMGDPDQRRDWLLTRLWSFAMDVLAIGMVILVASGVFLWLRRADTRRMGLLALTAGVACCAFFLFGLGAWIA